MCWVTAILKFVTLSRKKTQKLCKNLHSFCVSFIFELMRINKFLFIIFYKKKWNVYPPRFLPLCSLPKNKSLLRLSIRTSICLGSTIISFLRLFCAADLQKVLKSIPLNKLLIMFGTIIFLSFKINFSFAFFTYCPPIFELIFKRPG